MNGLFGECALDWLAVWRLETVHPAGSSAFSIQRRELLAKYNVRRHLEWRKRFLLAVNSVDLLLNADYFAIQFEYVLWCSAKTKNTSSMAVYLVCEEKRNELLHSQWQESLPEIGFFVLMQSDEPAMKSLFKEMSKFHLEAEWCKKREFCNFLKPFSSHANPPEPIRDFITGECVHLLSMKPQCRAFTQLLSCLNTLSGREERAADFWYDWKGKYHANATEMLHNFAQNHFSFLREFPALSQDQSKEQLMQLKKQLLQSRVCFSSETTKIVQFCRLFFGAAANEVLQAVLWNPFYDWLVERKAFLLVHLQKDLFSLLEGCIAVEREFLNNFPPEYMRECKEIVEKSLSSTLIHRLDSEKEEISLKEYPLTFPQNKPAFPPKDAISFLGNIAYIQNAVTNKLLPLTKDSVILASLETFVKQLFEDSCWKASTMIVFTFFFSNQTKISHLTKTNIQYHFQPMLEQCTQKLHPSHCNSFISSLYKALTLACTNMLYANISKVLAHTETLTQIQFELEEIEDFFVRHSNSIHGLEWHEAQKTSLPLFRTCKFFSIATPDQLLQLYLTQTCQNKPIRTFYSENSKYFSKDRLFCLLKHYSKVDKECKTLIQAHSSNE